MADGLGRPATAILIDIKRVCREIGGPSTQWRSVADPFAELLVRLSQDAEATASAVNVKTQKLIDLTRVLIMLTVILIVLTAPLVWIEVFGKKAESVLNFQEHGSYPAQ